MPLELHLYQGGDKDGVRYDEIAGFLRGLFPGWEVRLRENFFREALRRAPVASAPETLRGWAARLASLKIVDPARRWSGIRPFPAEVDFEYKKLTEPGKIRGGPLYEGLGLLNFCSELIPPEELPGKALHLIFTDRLFATQDENDRRYHARVSIYGLPSLISTSGVVEAPARPRDYYMKLRMGFDREELKGEFAGRFLEFNDPRLTEVLKGCVLQAVFYCLTGDPFCPDPGCRLFNAHFQEELLHAQLHSPTDLCPGHTELLSEIVG